MSLKRCAINLSLSALLLFAQHGALAHLISHINAGQSPASEKTLVHLKLCGKCVSAEKFTHAAPAQSLHLVAMDGTYPVTEQACDSCNTQESRWPYHARAPPQVL